MLQPQTHSPPPPPVNSLLVTAIQSLLVGRCVKQGESKGSTYAFSQLHLN